MGGDMMHAIRFRTGRLFGIAAAFLSAWMLTASAPLHAQSGDAGFDTYVQSLWPKAQARGVSRTTFDRVTEGQIGRAHVELQSLMRISYAVFFLKKNKTTRT